MRIFFSSREYSSRVGSWPGMGNSLPPPGEVEGNLGNSTVRGNSREFEGIRFEGNSVIFSFIVSQWRLSWSWSLSWFLWFIVSVLSVHLDYSLVCPCENEVLIPAHFQLSFDYSTTLLLYYSSTSWTTMPPKRTADTGMMKPSANSPKHVPVTVNFYLSSPYSPIASLSSCACPCSRR